MSDKMNRPQPLTGIKVLDFSTLMPGPLAGLMLAEAGAEVVKIERPGTGDEMRHFPPKWGRDSIAFHMLNRGKKSLAINLKDRGQLSLLEPLLRDADVILEQFRPGVMDRLGLGYRSVKELNPGIIYCSITGYGQSGSKMDVAGHDLNYSADSGLLSLSMGEQSRPVLPPVPLADIAGGTYPAVVNILLALLGREKSGEGAHLDISMTDNVFMLMSWALGQGILTGDWPKSGGELLTGGSARYQLYQASDGRHVAAAPLEQRFWEVFCDLIDLPKPLRDDAVSPSASLEACRRIFLSKPSDEWRRIFYGHDCCCTVVRSLSEAVSDPDFASRGLFAHTLTNEAGEELPACPVSVSPAFRGPADDPRHAPALGANNDEYLG